MNIKFDTAPPILLIVLIFVILLIAFILFIEPHIGKRKPTNKNEHGSSKFADFNEIKKTFDKENLNEIKKAGFPVYYDKNFSHCYFDNSSPHWVVIGSTGSGKSVTLVINEALMFAKAKEKHSVVITDPKGEIFRTTGKVFDDNGYEVKTIDFRNPHKSTKINIMQPIIDEYKQHILYNKKLFFLLSIFIKQNNIDVTKINDKKKYYDKIKNEYKLDDYILDIIINNIDKLKKNIKNRKLYDVDFFKGIDNIKDYFSSKDNDYLLEMIRENQNYSSKYQAEANRLVISLADLIFVEKDAKDPFWINASKQLFIGIVGLFLEDLKEGLINENKINISSVKKFQNSSLIKENQMYLLKNLNKMRNYGTLSKDYLMGILSSSENTLKSITAVFSEKMIPFDDINTENVTSTNEFEFNSLGKRPVALFIIVPDEDRTYFQLVTIIVGMMIKDLTKFANLPENRGQLPVPIEFIMDEFANCPPLNDIQTLVSVARSRRMRFQFFIQSFAQLDQVYGKEIASIILDNAALCYLKTNSVECAKIIASKLGKSTIFTNSTNQNLDPFKVGTNQTTSLMGRELLTETEIINLKYKTIIFPTVGNPIFRDTYLYSNVFPQYKDVEETNRKDSVIKRVISNYYTVEEMKSLYDKVENNSFENSGKEIESEFRKSSISRGRNISIGRRENDELSWAINQLKDSYCKDVQILEEFANGTYVMNVSKIFNTFEKRKIGILVNENYMLELAENTKAKKTTIFISPNNILKEEIRGY